MAGVDGPALRGVLGAGVAQGTAKSRVRLALAKLESILDRDLLEPSRPPKRPSQLLPSELRDRVLTAAWSARPVGQTVPRPPRISAVTAFARAADGLDRTLVGLGAPLWRTPVLRGLDAQGLVGHLIGVEHDMRRALAGDPAAADVDHVESTQAAAVQEALHPPEQTRRSWRAAADQTLDTLGSASDLDLDLDRVVELHRTGCPSARC